MSAAESRLISQNPLNDNNKYLSGCLHIFLEVIVHTASAPQFFFKTEK